MVFFTDKYDMRRALLTDAIRNFVLAPLSGILTRHLELVAGGSLEHPVGVVARVSNLHQMEIRTETCNNFPEKALNAKMPQKGATSGSPLGDSHPARYLIRSGYPRGGSQILDLLGVVINPEEASKEESHASSILDKEGCETIALVLL